MIILFLKVKKKKEVDFQEKKCYSNKVVVSIKTTDCSLKTKQSRNVNVLFLSLFLKRQQLSKSNNLIGEFDPGSGRTLAACLIHASRANFWELAPKS
jgi:hypothetical protein